MTVLVLGGAGYIGSHTVYALIEKGEDVVIVDNLETGHIEAVHPKARFYKGDIRDRAFIDSVFEKEKIDAVIHFAGFKAVGESVAKPLKYYRNNLDSTITLLEVMNEFGVKKIVFSSSATVYGDPEELPIKETAKLGVTNPYGATKLFIENILKDVYISDNDYSIAILRYFNPIGAHESGLLGEDPSDIPNNLMPYIVKVATGELPHLNIFGNDYDTKDGTGVRDYIHVVDLALGHISALKYIDKNKGIDYYNLGTGHGYSVMEIVSAFSEVNHVDVPYEIAPRRDGDIAECYADTTYAKEKLHWEATHDLTDMVESAYNFVVKNNE